MKITKKWLNSKNACIDGVKWYENQETEDADKLFKLAIDSKRYQDINWVISRKMNKRQRVQYAIFAAEQVIDIFESKYSGDDRPRKAITAAKNYLKNPCAKTKNAAAAADAAAAAYAVADAAAAAAAAAYAVADAAAAAAAAAYAVAAAAYAAAAAAADAAAAAAAADAAAAAAAADAAAAAAEKEKMYIKILTYGFKILTNN